jgi:hypothetical protein
MHNGVLHTCSIDGHTVEIRSQATMVGLATNGCIHNSSEFIEYLLHIDGTAVHPPPPGWVDENGIPFGNVRRGAFDTPGNALSWAQYTITGERQKRPIGHLVTTA